MLTSIPGFRLVTVCIAAQAPNTFGRPENVARTLQKVQSSPTAQERFSIGCKFEELGSTQKPGYHPEVSVGYRDHVPEFGCSMTGSHIRSDVALHREFFQKVIVECELPLRIEDTDRGFRLAHALDPKLIWTNPEVNPDYFQCRIPTATPEGLVNRLERFLAISAKPDKRRWQWTLLNEESPEQPDRGTCVYDWAVHSELPMTRADVNFSYVLECVEAVEGLKLFAGKKGFDTQLCQVVMSEDVWADFKIRTTREGHRLLIELHDPEPRRPIQQFEQVLGLEFERTGYVAVFS